MVKNSHFSALLSVFIILFTFMCAYPLSAYSRPKNTSELFPKPPAIEKDVLFWKQVYTKISTTEGYIHDNADLSVIYEKITIPGNLGYRARSRYTKKYKIKYKKILDKLIQALGNKQGSQIKKTQLNQAEKRVLALWPGTVRARDLSQAKKRLRFQLGQSDKFKAGLVRSGRWMPYIISQLKDMGLPLEIAALPHVESSFNYKAYSKVGAAGMWQFTRSTGRRYMRVDHVMDERLDPFIATLAAARLLKNNYAVTGTWPLALTAYNHGAAGMRRAAKKMGTKDIVTILRKYKSRSFGFASRNFYPSFLAALEISQQPEKYFKNIKLATPVDFEFIALMDYIATDTIMDALKIDRLDLMAANPALRPAVWDGNKYIPKNYKLRVDRTLSINIAQVYSGLHNIDPEKRFNNQKADRYHRVTKGQTLSIIAARYGIRMKDLIASNNMRNKHIIRIGQVLVLPQKARPESMLIAKKQTKVKEKNPPKQEPVAISQDGLYVVKKGDNIDRIAQKNAISVRQLLKLNNIHNKNKIYPGQKLVLIKAEDISKQDRVQLAQIDKQLSAKTIDMPEAFDTSPQIVDIQIVSGAENALKPGQLQPVEGIDEDSLAEEPLSKEGLSEGEELLADPTDYSVNGGHTIEIQAAETLGHYAEWLQIRARDLRRLNKMKYGKPVVVGQRLKLDFKKVKPQVFEAERILYHKTLQEEFFEKNQIVGTDKYRLNWGESVWKLTRKTYKIPFWLLRQYNPDLDLNRISADKIITFPKVKQRNI